MYTKEINGRQIFSECKTIRTDDGGWISNPTVEQILAAGWTEYTPPEIVQTEPEFNDIVIALKKMLSTEVSTLSDEDALAVAVLYPSWSSKLPYTDPNTGVTVYQQVEVGERLWYNGKLYKVVQLHDVQKNWTPDLTLNLYAEVSVAEIPDWVQPLGAETAYHIGDKVKWNGYTWESEYDNNVWEPGVYGWTQI